MHEHHRSVLRQYYIRLSSQLFSMQPKSVAKGMEKRANPHLGLSISPPYRRHIAAALFWGVYIAHGLVRCFALATKSSRVKGLTRLVFG
jgi:hypothetical protein